MTCEYALLDIRQCPEYVRGTHAPGIMISMMMTSMISLAWSLPAQSRAQDMVGERVINQSDNPLLRPFRWRSIGPIGQGGRVDDIEVSPTDPHLFLAGFATGGLWRTTNNGVTFRPVFDTYAATYQRRRTACCFVGGGPGSGIWRSDDGRESWSRLSGDGLPRGTMGRIALAMTPADANVIYAQIEVAADREKRPSREERIRRSPTRGRLDGPEIALRHP